MYNHGGQGGRHAVETLAAWAGLHKQELVQAVVVLTEVIEGDRAREVGVAGQG